MGEGRELRNARRVKGTQERESRSRLKLYFNFIIFLTEGYNSKFAFSIGWRKCKKLCILISIK